MRIRWGVCLVLLCSLSAASPALAATTIGQLGTGSTTPCNSSDLDIVQPTVTSGNGYVVPAGGGLITQWSTRTGGVLNRNLEMKVFRKVGDPARYQVVGHDGPHPLGPGTTNTFPVTIPVNPGDVLGLNTADAETFNNSCAFSAPGESLLYHVGSLADGTAGDFQSDANLRLNITAVVEPKPSNAFTLGKTQRNRKKGTATLTVQVPGPGKLALSGKGVKSQEATASGAIAAAGTVALSVRPSGATKKKLAAVGKATVSVTIGFTPTFGDLGTQTVKVKLKKKT
jgi:hypothetical protein